MPLLKIYSTNITGYLRPRMHGSPWHTSGNDVMRVSSSISFVR